jgi:molecular chaperone GrpE
MVDESHEEPAGDEPAGSDSPVPPTVEPDRVDADLAEAEAAIVSDIDAVQRERDDYLDALRRLQADFENYKKRMMKQQTEHLQRAAQALVEKLLPVLDAAELAVAHDGGEGVTQLGGLLLDTLQKEGLEGIEPKEGEPFDPTFHEAVAHEPGDGDRQEIARTMRAGYLWKGVLLRPAMVMVRG